MAIYSSGQSNEYFGWTDAKHDDVKALTATFHERMHEIVQASRGLDWEYAGWYVSMLGYAERGIFPIAHADWPFREDSPYLPATGGEGELLMPPPGEAIEEQGEG
ncbi:hypothetical protein SH501x_001176 [Pirellulaceae bacterium SH501]